ncbi:MFS transporter [Rhodococcus qingshengii]|uniref:MFS transporter n=1 Tax=Rhodococcus qingshengii TaxID=334542 RepID=UPI0035DF549B
MTTTTLHRAARHRFALAATTFAFFVTMMGTTLPTPLYTLYAEKLAFQPLTITVLFAVYAAGVVAALALFGRMSDQVGRRPVLLIAIMLSGLSAVAFLLSTSLPLLIAARVISGLSAGLMSGTGTAAVIDLFPAKQRKTAGTLAVAANTGGLAFGTIFAGVIADCAPAPLVLPYLAHLTLTLVASAALASCTPRSSGSGRWHAVRPQKLTVPHEIRTDFLRAVLSGGAAFATIGVLTAVGALFLSRNLHLASHSLAGFLVFLAFAGMAVGQLAARRLAPTTAMFLGCLGLTASSAILAVAIGFTLVAPLLIASALLGVCGGACMNAGLATTVERTEPALRGAVSSSYFAGLYAMLAIPAIGVGLLTSVSNLSTAGLVFSVGVGILALATAILELLTRSRRGAGLQPSGSVEEPVL